MSRKEIIVCAMVLSSQLNTIDFLAALIRV
jgi:hypothetical protein